jgi:hypothetical protein
MVTGSRWTCLKCVRRPQRYSTRGDHSHAIFCSGSSAKINIGSTGKEDFGGRQEQPAKTLTKDQDNALSATIDWSVLHITKSGKPCALIDILAISQRVRNCETCSYWCFTAHNIQKPTRAQNQRRMFSKMLGSSGNIDKKLRIRCRIIYSTIYSCLDLCYVAQKGTPSAVDHLP